jgi:hypothetical protein
MLPAQEWSKSQAIYADAASDGGYGDINACRGVPVFLASGNEIPRWSEFAWSEEEPARYVRIDEQFHEVRAVTAAPALGGASWGMCLTSDDTSPSNA